MATDPALTTTIRQTYGKAEPWRVYDTAQFFREAGLDPASVDVPSETFASAFIRATRPAASRACCDPDCCHG
jgi:hypothetical protein